MKIIELHSRYDNEPVIIRVDAINAIKKCFDREEDRREEYTSVQVGSTFFDVKEYIDVVMTRINEEMTKLLDREVEQESVLDKIRAEIAEIPKKYPMTMDYENGLKEALAIIDKYKAESEGV